MIYASSWIRFLIAISNIVTEHVIDLSTMQSIIHALTSDVDDFAQETTQVMVLFCNTHSIITIIIV